MTTSMPSGGGRWYYGWNIIAATILAQIAANGMSINAFSLFVRGWSAALHVPISTLQLAMAPLAIVTAASAPVIGMLADRRPARWLMGAGLILMAAFDFGISAMTATWQFIALYGLVLPFALGLSAIIVANAVVSRWFVRRLGLALGLAGFGVGIAGVLLPPIVAWALPMMSWRAIWRIAAALVAFVVTPIVMAVLRDRPTEREGLHYVAAAGPIPHHHGGSGGLGWSQIVRRKTFWLLVAIFVPVIASGSGTATNLAPIAAAHGVSTQAAGGLLSLLSIVQVASTLLMGLLSDRYGNRLPLCGMTICCAIGAFVVGFAGGLPALAVGVALLGVGGGLWTLVAAAIAVEFGAANVGRTLGLLLALLPLTAFTSFGIAKVKETTGAYTDAMLALSALALAGSLIVLLMRERRGGHATPSEKDAALKDAVAPVV